MMNITDVRKDDLEKLDNEYQLFLIDYQDCKTQIEVIQQQLNNHEIKVKKLQEDYDKFIQEYQTKRAILEADYKSILVTIDEKEEKLLSDYKKQQQEIHQEYVQVLNNIESLKQSHYQNN